MLSPGEEGQHCKVSEIEIKVPPIQYPTIRSLVLNFLIELASKSGGNYSFTGDTFVLRGDACATLREALLDVIDVFESRKNIDERGGYCPKLSSNRNDFDWVGNRIANEMGFQIEKDITICDFFVKLIKASAEIVSREPGVVAEELKSIRMDEGDIYLGRDESAQYPQLQVFKLEKYKYGKKYLSFTEFKGQMKISSIWYSILGAGWLLSFSGYLGSLLLAHIDEDAILSRLMLPGGDPGELLGALKEYTVLPLKEGYQPSHTEAYTLLLYLSIDPGKVDRLRNIPAKYSKIVFANTYVVVEDIGFDISPVYDGVELLIGKEEYTELRERIKEMLRCVLLDYARRPSKYCRDVWGDTSDLSAMVRYLWNIMSKMDPYTNAYRLIRASPPGKRNFRDPYIARKLLKWVDDIMRQGAVLE